MDEIELDTYITKIIDSESYAMIELIRGGVLNGRKAEQVKELGTVAECVSTCGVPCENILQD